MNTDKTILNHEDTKTRSGLSRPKPLRVFVPSWFKSVFICVHLWFLSLVYGQKLVRQLQDHQRDACSIHRPDEVTRPGAVAGLLLEQLIAGGGEIVAPVLVAR